MGGGQMMAMLPEWTPAYGLLVFVMWAVMMVAMMLPSAAPITLLIASLARKRRRSGRRHRICHRTLRHRLSRGVVRSSPPWRPCCNGGSMTAGLLSETMAVASMAAAGSVLIAAGIYQWTPLKQACLQALPLAVRVPDVPLADGRSAGSSAAPATAFCLGCCWMLMALLFVGGIMNLAWIAGIALLVLIEKTLPLAGWTERAAGIVLVVWGGLTLAMTG